MTENRSECRTGAPTMSYQIVCFSCGYRRVWPALADAVADGRHHAEEFSSCGRPALVTPLQPTTQECLPRSREQPEPVMASPEPELPETRERRCPACQSERIVNAGNVAFEGMMVKSEHR